MSYYDRYEDAPKFRYAKKMAADLRRTEDKRVINQQLRETEEEKAERLREEKESYDMASWDEYDSYDDWWYETRDQDDYVEPSFQEEEYDPYDDYYYDEGDMDWCWY